MEDGAEFVIARGSTQVARLVPVRGLGTRDLGFVAYEVPDSFFDDLPEDGLTAWESGGR